MGTRRGIQTKSGETFESLAKRTIGSRAIERSDIALAIVPVDCEANQFLSQPSPHLDRGEQ